MLCSGSGGVGKTTAALSIAACASKMGRKTILLDASGTARCSDMILGLESVVTLDMADVAAHTAALEAALYSVPRYENLRFACASLYDGISPGELSSVILALHSMCELLIVDMPTGQIAIGEGMMQEGDECIAVLKPDDASIRSAERILAHADGKATVSLLINFSNPQKMKHKIQYTQDVVQMILDRPILGELPEEPSVCSGAAKSRTAIEADGVFRERMNVITRTLLGA